MIITWQTRTHKIFLSLLRKKIYDENIIWLLEQIIYSFETEKGKGIPLGNLTSQFFANLYLNELDQFVKHGLKIKYYIRYSDDFIILSQDLNYLKELISKIEEFLKENLKLSLHKNKIIIRKYAQGIDFLGYIVLPHYILPRTKTKRRIFKKLKEKNGSENFNQSMQSYLGYCKHAKSFKITQELENQVWSWINL